MKTHAEAAEATMAPPGARMPTHAAATPVSSVMSREVITIERDMSVDDAVDLLFDRDLHRVPVLDEDGTPGGIVARTDLLAHLRRVARSGGANEAPVPVSDVMTRFPLRLKDTATVAQAAQMMALQRVHGVPVVDDSGRLVGMVSALDVLGWLAGLEE